MKARTGPIAATALANATGPRQRGWGFALTLVLAGLAAVSQSGCASLGGGAPGASQPGPVTDFDESPQRKRARIRLELAVNYFADGRTDIALDEIKQALAIDPQYPAALNLRGLVLMRLNEPSAAEDSFRRALALSPRDGDTLHNLAWLHCQQGRLSESQSTFQQALDAPGYRGQAKTHLAQGLCLARAGQGAQAERSLTRAYELDPGNPVATYQLSQVLFQRGDLGRAQFHIRRLNNSEFANAESLWLGIRVERRLGEGVAMAQLAEQLRRRYPQSRELGAFERGAFDE